MHAFALVAAAVGLLSSTAMAHPLFLNERDAVPFSCGTNGDPDPATLAAMQSFNDADIARIAGNASDSTSEKRANLLVNLYIHVVSTTAAQGAITQTMVDNQASVLQGAYAPYGIAFNTHPADFTVNDAWASDTSSSTDLAMKTALRKGTYADLNIYFQTALSGNLLGYCTLPTTAPPPGTTNFYLDGCNVAAQSMPKGNLNGYNYGFTAVHESGHWFGLLHPFQGQSCTGQGDFVVDTPQEATATSGCPTTKDTCADGTGLAVGSGGSSPGPDPIHNYMDYSYDVCYTQFTPLQSSRMNSMYTQFRAPTFAGYPSP